MALFNLSEFMTIGILNKSKNPVFRIQSIATGQEYVLKKLQRHDFQDHLSDFAELTYILRCCHHPNIIKILGFSMNYLNNEYNLCLLMDMHKTDLQRVIDNNRKTHEKFPKKKLFSLIVQLIDALYFIQNNAKIAHRDLKPANILLDANDNPLITDFSEAFFSDSIKPNTYREDGIKGTPEYMSPELKTLFLGTHSENIKYNPWNSDVYSLGVSLINLASSFATETSTANEEKLSIIQETYGKTVKSLLENLVNEDPISRGDFKKIIENKEFLKLKKKTSVYESPKISTLDDGENADRISIILEGDNFEEEEEIECFGRKVNDVNLVKQDSILDKIEESKEVKPMESSIHCHYQSPVKTYKKQSIVSKEMKELKNMLMNLKKEQKIDGAISQVFKKIVISIKELELENRVLLKEMKTTLLKKSSSMNKMSEVYRQNEMNRIRTGSNGGFTINETIPMRKSMNIIYNMETKNK